MTRSPHRALSIRDVVLAILDQLAPATASTHEDRGNLLHFGLTCKFIWELVEPRLWYTLTNEAIYCILPEDIQVSFDDRSLNDVSGTVWASGMRSLDEKELNSLMRYCGHARELCLWEASGIIPRRRRGFRHSLAALPQLHSKIQALQSLQHIILSNHRSCNVDLFAQSLVPLLGPQLRSIGLGLDGLKHGPSALFTSIAEQCSGLLVFSLDGMDMNRDVSGICKTLCNTVWRSCTSLKTIEVEAIDSSQELWTVLASLPDLEHLRLMFELSINVLQVSKPYGSQAFRSLRELTGPHEMLDEPEMTDTSSVVVAIDSPFMDKLEFTCPTGEKLCETISIIVDRWSSTIRELGLWTSWHEGAENSLTPRELLGRLYPLSRLERLAIHGLHLLDLEDHDIDHLVRAWPNLTRLELRVDDETLDPAVGVSLLSRRSIHTLAKAYPNLRSLAISIDHSLPYDQPPQDELVPTCPGVQLWQSVISNLDDIPATVAFMRRYFPNIRLFYGASTEMDRRLITGILGTTIDEHFNF
ncbi:hypothetical protein CALVIDRAFT_217565 [Calocera viscosa TUFC12733]|uniref:F-box domain-containing protein n=1 Tax=Calocera viscosa (strain TUFC12733) TaxID=1330018 RepID=A0A167RI35_CALVF|nr:hypothetical protein CALVIDRAFT_217565 [Calocera viscosa TUFC12733]